VVVELIGGKFKTDNDLGIKNGARSEPHKEGKGW